MNWKPTVLLLAVFVGLVLFFKYHESDQPDSKTLKEREARIFVMDRDRIDALTVTNRDQKIELRREKGRWRLISPIADRADQSVMDEVFTSMETAHKDATISAGDVAASKNKLQDFGLQNPRLRVQVTSTNEGKTATNELLFGNDTAVEGKTYLQIAGRGEVMVTDTGLKKLLEKDLNGWRDHKLTDLAATDVNKMTVKMPAGEIELQRAADHWRIVKPMSARANDQKINDLVSQVANLTISKFVGDDKADAIASYGLNEPRGAITLFTANEPKGIDVMIGSNPVPPKPPELADKNNPAPPPAPKPIDEVYVRLPSRQAVFTTPRSVEDFLVLKPNDLRDRELMRLAADTVDRIHIAPAGKPEIVLARKDKKWSILGQPDQPANGALADQLMQRLGQTETTQFVADSAADLPKYGLDKPAVKVTFSSYASQNTAESNAGEKPIATVDFGSAEGENLYARLEEEPFVVTVSKSILESVPIDPLQWQPLPVFNLDAEKINALEIKGIGRPDVSLTRSDKGAWANNAKGGLLPDAAKTQSLVNTLASLRAVRWAGEIKPEYHLDEPTLSFSFTTSADPKASYRLLLGAPSPEQTQYARVDGKPGAFLVNRPDYETLSEPLVPQPPGAAPSSPAPTPQAPPPVPLAPLPTAPATPPAPAETPTATPAPTTPAPTATPAPTIAPTPTAAPSPTAVPTTASTAVPLPTAAPTAVPVTPTPEPTATPAPTQTPATTPAPTVAPTATPVPTATPTAVPTATPTAAPTVTPTPAPTAVPTATPLPPTPAPTATPLPPSPTPAPSASPTAEATSAAP